MTDDTGDEMEPDIPENVYGHRKRLEWIISHLREGDRIVELGCGTGYMIMRPLCLLGYDAYGVDLDEESVRLGRELLDKQGLDPQRLRSMDLADLDWQADVIIASEVLEHITDEDQSRVFAAIDQVLKPDGRLLVTVPNGYGWFELESFVYFKLKVGRLIEFLRMHEIMAWLKRAVGAEPEDLPPSTVANSPHVQWFTRRSIRRLLERSEYQVDEVRQTVLFAGPFSNMLVTGVSVMMRANRKLGDLFPRCAAGFMLACRRRSGESPPTTSFESAGCAVSGTADG